MNLNELNQELLEYLDKHPHLKPMQKEINKTLGSLSTPEQRCYYITEEMHDSFELLHNLIQGLQHKLAGVV